MSRRTDRLLELGFASYAEYLQSNRWKATKKRYRASRLPQRCRICDERQVDLHHRTYKRIGAEWLTDLVPLCREHHDMLHEAVGKSHHTLWKKSNGYVKKQRKRRKATA